MIIRLEAVNEYRQETDERPEDNFRDIPEYPTKEDLVRKVLLRKNLETGGECVLPEKLSHTERLLDCS